VPRWASRFCDISPLGELKNSWSNTELQLPAGSPSRWKNIFTGETIVGQPGAAVRLDALLQHFPVALLIASA